MSKLMDFLKSLSSIKLRQTVCYHHFALIRKDDKLTIFIDGTEQVSTEELGNLTIEFWYCSNKSINKLMISKRKVEEK